MYYFSAYATWKPSAYAKHRLYVKALESMEVTPIMGKFKEKQRGCLSCRARWVAHEEKETDVNIALWLINTAYKDWFDLAFVVSNDSDLAPAVRMLRAEFPHKRVRIITPPGRRTSKELMQAAGGPRMIRTIKETHVRKSLLPGSDRTFGRRCDYETTRLCLNRRPYDKAGQRRPAGI